MRKNFGRVPSRGRVNRKKRGQGKLSSLLSIGKTIGKKSYNTAQKAIKIAKVLGKVYVTGKMIQQAVQ